MAWKGSSSSTVSTAKCQKGHSQKRLQTRGPFPSPPPAGWHVGAAMARASATLAWPMRMRPSRRHSGAATRARATRARSCAAIGAR
eukprot:7383989-Prymnesium_polylepis.1